jgi:uncharacterized membrane protein (UPF0127 family)
VRVVHETPGGEEVLATRVETAEGLLAKMRGLRFRRSLPEGFALVFPFDRAGRRDVDMLFVPFAIDVLWLVDGRVERTERLRPWVGFAIARADTLVELYQANQQLMNWPEVIQWENSTNKIWFTADTACGRYIGELQLLTQKTFVNQFDNGWEWHGVHDKGPILKG